MIVVHDSRFGLCIGRVGVGGIAQIDEEGLAEPGDGIVF
jgi:hypothetical protein